MSECVVRMEMPETCFGCDMFDDEDYGRCLIRYYNGEEDYIDYRVARKARMSWCPIVCALPENHGRLADIDAFKRDIDAVLRKMEPGEMKAGLSISLPMLSVTPTIVPAERSKK